MRTSVGFRVFLLLTVILCGLMVLNLRRTSENNSKAPESKDKPLTNNAKELDFSQEDIIPPEEIPQLEEELSLPNDAKLPEEEVPPPPEITLAKAVEPQLESTTDFSVDERGFWQGLGAVREHIFDEALAKALATFFKNENVTSILELGAGTGAYAKLLKSEGFFVSCYDGNPNTQELSEGRCGVIDLSKPVDFTSHEWALSLEVGEHIPNQFEEQFLSNLNNANKKGIILSWAVVGQGGRAHVNTHNNDYIKDKFKALGYTSDVWAENYLRGAAVYGWLKNTVMVFRKNV